MHFWQDGKLAKEQLLTTTCAALAFCDPSIIGVRYELNEKKRADLPDAVRKGTLFNVYLTPVI